MASFDAVVMDGYLSKETVRFVRDILASPERRMQMVDTNYAIAARHLKEHDPDRYKANAERVKKTAKYRQGRHQ